MFLRIGKLGVELCHSSKFDPAAAAAVRELDAPDAYLELLRID